MLTSIVAAALAVVGDPSTKFAISPAGPGVGRHAGALGGGMMTRSRGGALPAITVDYAYGLSPKVDVFANASFGINVNEDFGVLGVIDPGARIRLTAPGSVDFGIKLGGELTFLIFANGQGAAYVYLGGVPGLFVSGGSSTVRGTFGLDFPTYFAEATNAFGVGDIDGIGVAVRPYLSLEGAIDEDTKLFVKGEAEVGVAELEGLLYAVIALGASF